MASTLLYLLFGILFLYSAFSVFYLFIQSFAGRFFYKKIIPAYAAPSNRIAVLVPAYKEDGIIYSTAASLLRVDYPANLYDIYIIADSFQPETLERLRELPIQVLEVSFDKSTKTKSLNEAFRRISKPYDIALICDADNILARDFLKKIDFYFVQGFRAVQGRRVAKNLDTSFAILDAASEGINNNIFRKGANALGISSAVIGSGMAFDYKMLVQIMSEVHAVGGFDKILQLRIVEKGLKIRYVEDALIFDEKVDSSHAFRQQRKRWVSSQFIYLKKFFKPALRQLFKGNMSYVNLAIFNNLVLPRAFLFVMLPLLVLLSLFLDTGWIIASAGLLLLYGLTLVLAIPSELVNGDLFKAALRLPKAVLVMVGTLFGIKKANKTFIHTVHTKTEVSNTLFKDHVN
jgi:cellulose synthase/poly-beta-1,6-N-acetylglucosamine synthase-like glycosyltransferase